MHFCWDTNSINLYLTIVCDVLYILIEVPWILFTLFCVWLTIALQFLLWSQSTLSGFLFLLLLEWKPLLPFCSMLVGLDATNNISLSKGIQWGMIKMNLQCVDSIMMMYPDFGNCPFTYIRWEEGSYCSSTIEDF
jgi:hypothetical protein